MKGDLMKEINNVSTESFKNIFVYLTINQKLSTRTHDTLHLHGIYHLYHRLKNFVIKLQLPFTL